MAEQSHHSVWRHPGTRLGWWAFGLGTAFIVMYIINAAIFMQLPEQVGWRQSLLPFYGILMLLCGLAGGIVSLIALIRKHERSWMVWLSLWPAALVLFLLLGEFLFPH